MSNKDIFDQLKAEADQLRETPSPAAWSRIEERLQAANRPKVEHKRMRTLRPRFVRPMNMAAGIALLLGLVVVFLWMADQQKMTPPIAQANTLEWEELSLTSSSPNTTEVIEIAATHPQPVALKPIEEGRANQRLVAKQEVRSNSSIRNSQQDSARNVTERTGR